MAIEPFDSQGNIQTPLFLGLPIKNLSLSSSPSSAGNYSATLILEPGKRLDLNRDSINSDPTNNIILIEVGGIRVSGTLDSMQEDVININGTKTINIRIIERSAPPFIIGFYPWFNDVFTTIKSSDLIDSHQGEIIKLSKGSSNDSDQVNIFTGENAGIQDLFKESFQLEVIGLPKTNIQRLNATNTDIIFADQTRKAFNKRIQNGTLPTDTDFNDFLEERTMARTASREDACGSVQISPRQSTENSILERYPKPLDSNLPNSISINFGEKGITTTYSFNVRTGSVFRRVSNLETSVSATRKDKSRRNADRDCVADFFCEKIIDDAGFCDQVRSSAIALGDESAIRDRVEDSIDDAFFRLKAQEINYELQRPTGGLGVIIGKSANGPFYRVRRLSKADFDPDIGRTPNALGLFFSIEWESVRNLSEPLDSPGYLLAGTNVTVQIYDMGEGRNGKPFIDQSPQTFAPPLS